MEAWNSIKLVCCLIILTVWIYIALVLILSNQWLYKYDESFTVSDISITNFNSKSTDIKCNHSAHIVCYYKSPGDDPVVLQVQDIDPFLCTHLIFTPALIYNVSIELTSDKDYMVSILIRIM